MIIVGYSSKYLCRQEKPVLFSYVEPHVYKYEHAHFFVHMYMYRCVFVRVRLCSVVEKSTDFQSWNLGFERFWNLGF